jgi:hypothetical protein
MVHRVSLTKINGLTLLSNQMDRLKNVSFLLAIVINVLILLSVSANPGTGKLPDTDIEDLMDAIDIGTSGPLGSSSTYAVIRCGMGAGWVRDGCGMGAGWVRDGFRMGAGWVRDGWVGGWSGRRRKG